MQEGVRLGQGYLLARPAAASKVRLPIRVTATAETLLRHDPTGDTDAHARKPN